MVNAIRCLPSLRSILVYVTLHLGHSVLHKGRLEHLASTLLCSPANLGFVAPMLKFALRLQSASTHTNQKRRTRVALDHRVGRGCIGGSRPHTTVGESPGSNRIGSDPYDGHHVALRYGQSGNSGAQSTRGTFKRNFVHSHQHHSRASRDYFDSNS